MKEEEIRKRVERDINQQKEFLAVQESNLAKALDFDNQSSFLTFEDAMESLKNIYHCKIRIQDLQQLLYYFD